MYKSPISSPRSICSRVYSASLYRDVSRLRQEREKESERAALVLWRKAAINRQVGRENVSRELARSEYEGREKRPAGRLFFYSLYFFGIADRSSSDMRA